MSAELHEGEQTPMSPLHRAVPKLSPFWSNPFWFRLTGMLLKPWLKPWLKPLVKTCRFMLFTLDSSSWLYRFRVSRRRSLDRKFWVKMPHKIVYCFTLLASRIWGAACPFMANISKTISICVLNFIFTFTLLVRCFQRLFVFEFVLIYEEHFY